MTTITALPTPPSRDDPTHFRTRADAFLTALPTFGTQANALAAAVNANRVTVEAQVGAAMLAGLGNAASNAATCTTKAAEAKADAASAAAAKVGAEAAWSAALAANPDLNPWGRMNPSTLLDNFTLAAGYNAVSAGPLTIGEGVDITLADHSNWTIV
jgi:hypothetical protein